MICSRVKPKKQSGANRKNKQNGKVPNGSIQNGQTEQTQRDGANSLKRTGEKRAEVKGDITTRNQSSLRGTRRNKARKMKLRSRILKNKTNKKRQSETKHKEEE